jgi:hypothetical protein
MYKIVGVCVACAVGAFVVVQLYVGGGLGFADTAAEKLPVAEEPPAALFPEALVPATRGESVPQAAAFVPNAKEPHPTVILQRSGVLFEEWHTRLQPGWQAETVEMTELVLIVGPQKKSSLQVITYPNGAPPITRYRHDVDAWLVEAKTGKELARQRFTTIARAVRPVENWDLTELGQPVDLPEVSEWLKEQAAAYATRLVNGR